MINNKMLRTIWLKFGFIASLFFLLSSCAAFPWLPERAGNVSERFTKGRGDFPRDGINLGMIINLSNPSTIGAKEAVDGARVAIEQINKAGGIKGQPLQLIVKDSKNSIVTAVHEANILVSQARVSTIIAPLASKETYEIARAVEGQAIVLAYTANAQYLTSPPRNITALFQIGPSSIMEGKAQAIDLANKEYKSYFILGADTDESRSQVDAFKESLRILKHDVEFIGETWLPSGTTDYLPAIEKALSAQPQMVFSTLYGPDLTTFTRQAIPFGFFNKVAFTGAYDAGVLQELKQDMLPGIRAYSRAPFFAFNTTLIRRFVERYLEKTGLYPSDTATLAYDSVRVGAQLIATSDSIKWLDMLRRSEGMKFEFLMGEGYLRAYDHQSSLGLFIGETKWNDTYGFMTYDNLRYLPSDDLWNSVESLINIKTRPPTVKVGIVTDLTGELAATAKESVAALEVAIERINKAGGILGRQIELVKRDTELNPLRAATIAEDLILKEKVNAIIGPVSNTTATALTGIAQKYGIPFIFHYANSERLTTKLYNDQIIQIGPSSYIYGRLQAVVLAERKYSRYYILGQRYGAAQEQAEAFKEWMKKLRPDVKILGEIWLPIDTPDYYETINTILAAKPEIVYSNLGGENLVKFTKQAKDLNFFNQVAFAAPYDVGSLQELKQDMVSGIIAFSRAPFFASKDIKMKDFVKDYQAKTSLYPSDAAVLSFEAMSWWLYMVNGSEQLSLPTGRMGGTNYISLFGPATIRAIDHQSSIGIFTGQPEWNNEYGFMGYSNLKYLPSEQVWRSPQELSAIRQQP